MIIGFRAQSFWLWDDGVSTFAVQVQGFRVYGLEQARGRLLLQSALSSEQPAQRRKLPLTV